MKKLILSIAVFAGVLSASAQTPVGSVVSNFNLTDINGNTQNLFAILDAGKMVVIDVSATWCGPCWNYHNTGALNTFYAAHGPAGANDAMVLFIEGDATTTSADLNGTGANTQGNWVAGENFPIIDLTTGASFTNSGLEIPYFPVMYVICPNRTVIQSGVAGAIGTVALLNSYVGTCPAPASNPADVAALAYKGSLVHCEGSYTPMVQIQNNGTSALTSATITVTQGGTTVSTGSYTGSLATYGVATVNCTPIPSFTGGALTVTVTTTGDALATNNAVTANIATALIAVSQYATVNITTDAYGSETTWKIKNSTGTVVSQGGPWTDLTAAGQTVQTPVTVALSASQCYTFEIYDAYGDGICCNYGDGAYSVTDAAANTLVSGASFGAMEASVFKTGVLGLNEMELMAVNVYPNPAADVVNVSFEANNQDVAVALIDIQGRTIATKNLSNLSGTQVVSFSTENVAKGSYIVSITANGFTSTKNVIIK